MNPTWKALARIAVAMVLIPFGSGGAEAAELQIVPRFPVSPSEPNTVVMREGDELLRVRPTAPLTEDLTFTYHTMAGTAEAGSDYEAFSRTATFPAWTDGGTIYLQLPRNAWREDDEDFFVVFESLDQRSLGSIRVVIEADPRLRPVTPISADEPNVTEVSEAVMAVRVMRTGPVDAELRGRVWTATGTATADDFGVTSIPGLLFAAGEAEHDFYLGIRNDLEPEPIETVFIHFEAEDGREIDAIEVRIVSDDLTQPVYNPLRPEGVCIERAEGEALLQSIVTGERIFTVTGGADAGALRRLRRHLPDGTTDSSFAEFQAYDLIAFPLADGGSMVAGKLAADAPTILLRLKPDGTVDSAFQQRELGTILDVEQAPLGRFYVLRQQVGTTARSIVRLNANGATDDTFVSPTGVAFFELMEVGPDGLLYLTTPRPRATGAGTDSRTLVRLQNSGAIDLSFAEVPSVRRLETYADGVYISSGSLYRRILPSGEFDPGFQAILDGSSWLFPVRDASGRFYGMPGTVPFGFRLERYTANGQPDPEFVPGTFDTFGIRRAYLGVIGSYVYTANPGTVNGVSSPCSLVRFATEPLPVRIEIAPALTTATRLTAFNRIAESGGRIELLVARTGANDQLLRARYTSRSGTATEGTDFTPIRGTIEFAPGITRMPISIEPLNDTHVEPDENFALDFVAEDGSPLGSIELIIPNDDLGLAIANPITLPDGRLRIRFLHDLPTPQPVRSSSDLINWTDYPSYQLDGQQYIDVDPREGTRYFATEQFPERELPFP